MDVIAFDVYGTLVDPMALSGRLAGIVGEERAAGAAATWRATQLTYAFRRAAMGPEAYVDFTEVTRQALAFACRQFGAELDGEGEKALLAAYRVLPAFPDAVPGLASLRGPGRRLVACSNGTAEAVRATLAHAGILPLLDDVVSVDEVRTFKPHPRVYRHLVERGGAPAERTWLVSSNGWDVIGAKHAGLRAVWLACDPAAILDPWGIEPDARVGSLAELAGRF